MRQSSAWLILIDSAHQNLVKQSKKSQDILEPYKYVTRFLEFIQKICICFLFEHFQTF